MSPAALASTIHGRILFVNHRALWRHPFWWIMAFVLALITFILLMPGVSFEVNGEPYYGPRWVPLAQMWAWFIVIGYLGGVTVVTTNNSLWMQSWLRVRRIVHSDIAAVSVQEKSAPMWSWPGFPFWFGIFPLKLGDYSIGGMAKVAITCNDGKRFFVGTRDPVALAASMGKPLS